MFDHKVLVSLVQLISLLAGILPDLPLLSILACSLMHVSQLFFRKLFCILQQHKTRALTAYLGRREFTLLLLG